jgi:transcriptional regulator with XRE-family HTH domain
MFAPCLAKHKSMIGETKVSDLRGNAAWQRRVGDAVRKAREERQMTQTELSIKSGVEYGTISHLELAKRIPTLPVLEALADAMFISIDELVAHKVKAPDAVDGLSKEQRAELERRMKGEIISFLRDLSPERIAELARPSVPDTESRPRVVSKRRGPRPL